MKSVMRQGAFLGVSSSPISSLMNCSICKRLLNNSDDPLSGDCGGDCWGCIGAIEAEMSFEPSLEMVREEAALGLRPGWGEPKKEQDKS
jgi:hypothetical protein